jgi:integrase
MRGCGLRIEEALAVCKEDFIEDGTVLRVAWQASGDGKRREPLKHRKAGEYRDVPIPSWLWEMVRDIPDGPLIPGNGKLFQRYGTVYFRFMHAAEAAGIPDGFTPHSLRHAFASAMLARGVQITELAHFLGHRDINVTHQVYGHLLPSAAGRAGVLPTWTRADAVNERPHTGGCECHAARCPFPLVARLCLTACPTSHTTK